tara:strand:- start:196 stop:444 length:249 start_codon:yes stop_codon:yes gene_type:complete
MKKILIICMLLGSSFIFTKDYNLHGVYGDEFIMCYERGRGARDRIVSCINDSLNNGYQLYGDMNMTSSESVGIMVSQSLVKK